MLAVGICDYLAVLYYFNYFNLVTSNLATARGIDFVARTMVMPVGISFFSFTQIAHLVDCFRCRS